MLKKVVRYGLKTVGLILGAVILTWVILWIYVVQNEEKLVGKVSSAIHDKTRGDVKIGGLSVSFFRTFPLLSLQLTDIVIRDSLYNRHHKDLFSASDVYLRVSIPGLITGNSPIGKVIVQNGTINLVTDSVGNSNDYMLRSEEKMEEKKSLLPDVLLKNMIVNYEDPRRYKHHYAIINSLKTSFKQLDGRLLIGIKVKMLVKNLGFNTIRGAYLKEKMVQGDFDVMFDKNKKELLLDNIRLYLDGHPFYFNGKFNTDNRFADFNLSIKTHNITFSKASSFVNDSISKKMEKYSFIKPVDLSAELSGKALYKVIPLVEVTMDVKNNKVIMPQGVFEDCNFTVLFTNELVQGKKRLDENSGILVKNFSGQWEKIHISSRLIKISNLINPYLECDISSDVDLPSLNSLTGSTTLQFLKGKTSIGIVFKGPVNGSDSVASNINGEVNIRNASVRYLPRNFILSDLDANLKFKNNDLFVNKLSAHAGKTRLVMNGSAKNFLSLLNISPEKLVLNWNITSPEVHLSDFKEFLTKAETKKGGSKKAQLASTASKVDKMFADGNVYINLETPSMDYKTFKATNVKAKVILKAKEITLENVSLNHAGGSMDVTGSMINGVRFNPVLLHTRMRNMDIPLLFTAFKNFGQDAITHKNLKGKLSADIDFRTAITNNAELVTDTSEGTIHFLLENGELNNFEPLMEVAKKAFKKQDFSQIRFADLKNKLDVRGTTFIVNPMDIRSTALNFFVEGVYDYKKGTDMSIRLPLRNLMKSQANTDISDEGKSKKGVSLRLRAKTGDDGKLKVSWDPFKLAIRNKQDVKDSTELKN